MARPRWWMVALLSIPVVDVVLLVYVAGIIGAVETVLVVVLTGLIGLLLVRAEGRLALGRLQRKFAAGEAPTDELLDGGLLIAAGVCLLTPGLVTDAIGLLLVLPPTRIPIRAGLKRWVVVPQLDARTGGFVTGRAWGDYEGPTVDLGSEAYDIDIEDDGEEEPGKGNA